MTVQWSRDAACWTWTCVFGCWGFDCESEQEAREAFLMHTCAPTLPVGVVGSEPCS